MFLNFSKKYIRQWSAVILANQCMFLAGICIGWSSPSLTKLQSSDNPFEVSNDDASWIASILNIGSAVGTVVCSALTRMFGPKSSLTMSSVPSVIGLTFLALCGSVSQLIAGRFFLGLGISFAFVSLPMYISEISEAAIRGSLMVSYSITVCLGILFSTCLGPYVDIQMMSLITLYAPLVLTLTYLLPESPHFCFRKGRDQEAIASLMYFRGARDEDEVKEEIKEIKSNLQKNESFLKCLLEIRERPNAKILGIVGCTLFAQQLGGCIPVAYYQEQILRSANIPVNPEIGAIITQTFYILSGVVSLSFVDGFGRKTMLCTTIFTSSLSSLVMGLYFTFYDWFQQFPVLRWIPLVCIMGIFFSFITGLGSMPYLMINEMTLSNFKEITLSYAAITGSLIGSTIAKLFQIITDSSGLSSAFYTLAGCSMSILLVCLLVVPETKDRSVTEIQDSLKGKKSSQSPLPT